ncbi:Lrp/AsnC family transcriptional regulator [Candidatus Woesearchaeota archaeon]|nr:Lrp/AsnC family transcriptional regulator [Candidatus Woesearchaeota archaeon]
MAEEDLQILRMLRNDARIKLADVAREINIPKTTVHDKYRRLKNNMILKYTTLVDFKKLGRPIRVNIAIEAKRKETLKDFLLSHPDINSVSTLANYDFYVDAVFRNMAEMHDFLEELRLYKVTKKNVHHIIEELKTEDFLTKERHLKMVR